MLRIFISIVALAFSGMAHGQLDDMQAIAEALAGNKEALSEMKFGEGEVSGLLTMALGETVVKHDGGSYDGLYFKVPEAIDGKDFVWYFNAPEGWANWYILPLEEDAKEGFRGWLYGDKVYEKYDKAGEKGRFRALQTLEGSYFEPGKEYVLWFRQVGDAEPGEVRLIAAFAKPGEEDEWDHKALEKALALKPTPPEAQAAELDSLGARILLDGKFFDRGYAEDRIDSLFFAKRQQKQMSGGFFIQISTSTPPCRTEPKLADIIAKYGQPDFVRSSAEEARRRVDEEEEGDDEPTVTYFYDYFGFVVNEGDADKIVQQVTAQANDFSSLRPKTDARSTFGKLGFENLTVFHFDGDEVGRIYRFDEEGKEPLVITAPPEGAYENGPLTLTYLEDGKWTMEGVYDSGKKGYIKRYARNRLHGLTESFHESGKTKLSMPYKDGLLHGKVTEFDEDGGHVRELIYREGELRD